MTTATALWAVVSVLAIVVIVLAVLVVGLLRRAAPILERAEHLLAAGTTSGANVLEGLTAGARVDPFVVSDQTGRSMVAGDVLAGPRTLVLLLSTHCEPCQALSQEMTGRSWDTPAARLVVIETLEPGASPLPVCSDADLYVQGPGQEASAAFGSNITPHAFVVDEHATVLAKAIPESLNQLRTLATYLDARGEADTHEVGGSHHHAHQETFSVQASRPTPEEAAPVLSNQPTRTR